MAVLYQLRVLRGADAISAVFANTNIAACAGEVVSMILTQLLYNKVDLTMVLNGALSGLAAIIAGPNYPSMGTAILIDGIGGALVVYAVPMFDKLKIDDTVGALSVPLVNGIRGMFAVGIFKPDVALGAQIIGILYFGVFVFGTSFVVWLALKLVVGLRASEEEFSGMDMPEFGLAAYPEFIQSVGYDHSSGNGKN